MTQRIDSQKARKISSRNRLPVAAKSNTLKAQFLKDMELAGLAATSRRTYLDAVEQLVRYYWCGPNELSEQQVSDYLLERHRDHVPKGSFKVQRFALRFFFGQTLGRDWHLFKKKCGHYLSSVCPGSWITATACNLSIRSIVPSIAAACR